VLIVDDDADIRDSFAGVLRYEGYEVTSCENGRAALERLRGGARSDVIVLDLMMPVMDGWQFRLAQKSDPSLASIPVVAVSADRTAKAAAIDADAFLSKPVDAGALLATLDRLFLARERAELRARLVETDRLSSLGTVAASVAHEINNPLAYVIANLDLVARSLGEGEGPGPAVRTALEHASQGLERIRTIVHDLRTFSRPEGEQHGPVSVERVLDSAANIASSEIQHRAHLRKDYGDVPPVFANEARLGQVFLNLIINAAQAIPEGDADAQEIRLVTRRSARGGVVIEVHDTGAGIPPEMVDRIFEPFFTTKPLGEGTGLGLSICRSIVTTLGGTLEVESAPGRGSVFRVELGPQLVAATAGAPEGGAAPPAPAAPPSSPPPASARRGKLLFVDDEARLCSIMGELLGAEHDVTTLTSAAVAAERIAAGERFDLIFSDLMMPGMSGMDLHAELTKTAPDQAERMVFLTGGAFTPRAMAFVASTPNRFLEKPFDPEELLALVRERLR
jgi:signal transduction histidine kinase